MLILSLMMICFWKRRQKRERAIAAPIGKLVEASTFLFLFIYMFSFYVLIVFISTVSQDIGQDLLINEGVLSSRRHVSGESKTENSELPLMEYKAVVIATDNFSDSNKLGKGGFGFVYKVKNLNTLKGDTLSLDIVLLTFKYS